MLAWYLLNHYLFWHISNFSWKVGNRVLCILRGHIHLERRKKVRVRNHSDPNPRVPVINTLWTRFCGSLPVVKAPSCRGAQSEPNALLCRVCEDTTLLWPRKMWIRWQNMHSRVNSLDTAAYLLGCSSQRLCQVWEKHRGTSATVLIT